MAICGECGKYVKDENILRHYRDVHPALPIPRVKPANRVVRRKAPVSGKTKKIAIVILALLALVIIGAFLRVPISPVPDLDGSDCINHSNLAYHWHARLTITDSGRNVEVPAGIGITLTCMSPTHTHDGNGLIHIESPTADARYTLEYFFEVWGRPFGSPQMTVDGWSSTEGASLVLLDGQDIQLTYQTLL